MIFRNDIDKSFPVLYTVLGNKTNKSILKQEITMIINNTSEFFEELTKAALTNSGWEVEPVSGFIRAIHPNKEESYLICTVGRSLSHRQEK